MIRTQMYLPKELYQSVSLVAKREKKTKAEVIRKALEEGLKKTSRTKNAGDVLLEIARVAEKLNAKGPKDLSQNIDKYLYGE